MAFRVLRRRRGARVVKYNDMSDEDWEHVYHDNKLPIVAEGGETMGDELKVAIDLIEDSATRIRVEHTKLRNDYLAGKWKEHGLTKRECEDRLARRTGEILGHEMCLSVLYTLDNVEEP